MNDTKIVPSNYRLYTFINFYLSSIQSGIQSAHIVSEMYVKYFDNKNEATNEHKMNVIKRWASQDKTIIVLNGGTSQDLNNDYNRVSMLDHSSYTDKSHDIFFNIPYIKFYESPDALGISEQGIMTGFGIIVPEQIYNADLFKTEANPEPDYIYKIPNTIETIVYPKNIILWDIINIIKTKGLAR